MVRVLGEGQEMQKKKGGGRRKKRKDVKRRMGSNRVEWDVMEKRYGRR